jgi:hypothetical protein
MQQSMVWENSDDSNTDRHTPDVPPERIDLAMQQHRHDRERQRRRYHDRGLLQKQSEHRERGGRRSGARRQRYRQRWRPHRDRAMRREPVVPHHYAQIAPMADVGEEARARHTRAILTAGVRRATSGAACCPRAAPGPPLCYGPLAPRPPSLARSPPTALAHRSFARHRHRRLRRSPPASCSTPARLSHRCLALSAIHAASVVLALILCGVASPAGARVTQFQHCKNC